MLLSPTTETIEDLHHCCRGLTGLEPTWVAQRVMGL